MNALNCAALTALKTWTASPLFYIFVLLVTLLCVMGYKFSWFIHRKSKGYLPDCCILVKSEVFRFRRGMKWEYGSFQITAKDMLKHWRGIRVGRGAGCQLQAYLAETDEGENCLSIGRRHARLDFDEKKHRFYIEDTDSKNKIRWSPLEEPQHPKLVDGRIYLSGNTLIRLGEVPLELYFHPIDNIPSAREPGNTVGAWMVIALQPMGLAFCVGYTGGFTVIRCIPGLLLTLVVLQTLFYDHARSPVPGMIFAAFSYAWVLYISFSGNPDGAALAFSRALFCVGTAVICLLPDASEQDAYHFSGHSYLKAGGAVLLAVILYHYKIISTFNDAIFLFALILARKSKDWRDLIKKAL